MTAKTRLARLEALHRPAPCPCERDLRSALRYVPPEDVEAVEAHLAEHGPPVERCERCGRRLPAPVFIGVDLSRV
jgi:hypothetical protein